jgi:hypothetical protein
VVIEGLVSAFTIGFLAKVKPALLEPAFVQSEKAAHA